jgi:hypothetical protein
VTSKYRVNKFYMSELVDGVSSVRLVVLMVEAEQPEGVSARKLILETAHQNVLAAYSEEEAVDLIRRFPNVDLAVIHTELEGDQFTSIVRSLRAERPDLCIVAISPGPYGSRDGVNGVINSHSPQDLLTFLSTKLHANTLPGRQVKESGRQVKEY